MNVTERIRSRVQGRYLVQIFPIGGLQGMLKDLHLLEDCQMVVVRGHAHHEAVLHIQRDLARLTIFPDRGVQSVRIGNPANEAAVG